MRQDWEKHIGRKITGVEADEEKVVLELGFGAPRLKLSDGGQGCCEYRYMRTDDDPKTLVGKRLAKIEGKEGPETEDDYGCHEIAFLEITTECGERVNFCFHNEHNGYYGGFSLQIEEQDNA